MSCGCTRKNGLTSIHKFFALLEMCEKLGVHTRPAFISEDCAICPLFSWYTDNLVDGFNRDKANIPFDTNTLWPWSLTGRGDTNDAQQPEIAEYFLQMNTRWVDASLLSFAAFTVACGVGPCLACVVCVCALLCHRHKLQLDTAVVFGTLDRRLACAPASEARKDRQQKDGPFVISFSHFVSRQECYPGPRRLCGVMGCKEIEHQVRRVGARCHVFGHSHIACDRELDSVRYVQHPLGSCDVNGGVSDIFQDADCVFCGVVLGRVPLYVLVLHVSQPEAERTQVLRERFKRTEREALPELHLAPASWAEQGQEMAQRLQRADPQRGCSSGNAAGRLIWERGGTLEGWPLLRRRP